MIAAVNSKAEILLVEIATGKEIARYELGSSVLIAHFVTGKETRLLVLTADQVATVCRSSNNPL